MSAGYLLDTSVVSLLAPGRLSSDATLEGWIRDRNEALYISAVTISEIEQGVCKLRRAGGADRADTLERWLDAVIDDGGDRILPFDARAGRIAGDVRQWRHVHDAIPAMRSGG